MRISLMLLCALLIGHLVACDSSQTNGQMTITGAHVLLDGGSIVVFGALENGVVVNYEYDASVSGSNAQNRFSFSSDGIPVSQPEAARRLLIELDQYVRTYVNGSSITHLDLASLDEDVPGHLPLVAAAFLQQICIYSKNTYTMSTECEFYLN